MATRRTRPSKLTHLLRNKEQSINQPLGLRGVLARLFRQILLIRGINNNTWSRLLNDYVKSVSEELGSSDPDKATRRYKTGLRGNLTKAFYNTDMTWSVFCKGLKFFKVKSFRIKIDLEFEDGQIATIEDLNLLSSRVEPVTMEDETEDNEDD